eukprot:8284338-Lingulodinium_polyedra.AAC.1
MNWRARGASAHAVFRRVEAAKRAFDRALHGDAGKRAFRRFSEAKCAKHARAPCARHEMVRAWR